MSGLQRYGDDDRRRPAPSSEFRPLDDVLTTRETALVQAYDELLEKEASGRRTAWIVASVLLVVCGAQAAAIALLTPLKEVVPYTLLVDRTTGYVETVRGVELGDLPEDEAITQAFLAQYVLARETIDPVDFNDRYTRVAMWSEAGARDAYIAKVREEAARGEAGGAPAGAVARVRVTGVEIIDKATARVRFDVTRIDDNPDRTQASWQAMVGFRYVGAPMRAEDRLLNPLGFQVTAYTRQAEGVARALDAEPGPANDAVQQTDQTASTAPRPLPAPSASSARPEAVRVPIPKSQPPKSDPTRTEKPPSERTIEGPVP